jgi:hypothetical protein
MDWIEGQLDDESIFPQKLGMLLFLWICGALSVSYEHMILEQSRMVYDLEFGFPLSRHTVPAKLQGNSQDNIQAFVSYLCPHTSLSFSEDCQPKGGGSS